MQGVNEKGYTGAWIMQRRSSSSLWPVSEEEAWGGRNPPSGMVLWRRLVKVTPLSGPVLSSECTVFKVQSAVTTRHSASIWKLWGRDPPSLLCCGSVEVHSRLPLLLEHSWLFQMTAFDACFLSFFFFSPSLPLCYHCHDAQRTVISHDVRLPPSVLHEKTGEWTAAIMASS